MKWLIASDIHGSAYYCRELMKAFEREQAERKLGYKIVRTGKAE